MTLKQLSEKEKEQLTQAIKHILNGIACAIPTNKTPDTQKGAECIVKGIEIFANIED